MGQMKKLAEEINIRTKYSRYALEDAFRNAKNAQADSKKDARLYEQECIYCYYFEHNRIVGQAFTGYTCTICHQTKLWHNTGTPDVCPECAKYYNICKRCGANINLENIEEVESQNDKK